EALAVPRQVPVLVVDDFHLDAERRPALLALDGELFLARQRRLAGLERADRAERTHFGHAPGVAHFDAVVFLKSADHLGRTGRAADDDELERREFLALLAQVMQQP